MSANFGNAYLSGVIRRGLAPAARILQNRLSARSVAIQEPVRATGEPQSIESTSTELAPDTQVHSNAGNQPLAFDFKPGSTILQDDAGLETFERFDVAGVSDRPKPPPIR